MWEAEVKCSQKGWQLASSRRKRRKIRGDNRASASAIYHHHAPCSAGAAEDDQRRAGRQSGKDLQQTIASSAWPTMPPEETIIWVREQLCPCASQVTRRRRRPSIPSAAATANKQCRTIQLLSWEEPPPPSPLKITITVNICQQTVCQLLELTSELTSSEDVLPSSSSFSLSFSIRPRGPGAKTMAVVVDFV